MAARKKRDGDSSLELLLDTMCNTFGGVMFIAIALVVLMAMLSPQKQESQEQNQNFQQKLEKLQQELSELVQDNSKLEEAVRKLENDPRKELLTELLTLESQKQKQQIELEILEKTYILVRQEFDLTHQKLEKLQKEQKQLSLQNEEKEKRIREVDKKIAAMKNQMQNVAEQIMTFRVMEKSAHSFYALIVWQDQIWKAGPDYDEASRKIMVNGACQSQEFQQNGTKVYRCTPIQGKGIPIMRNGTVSPDVIALLKSIPADRVPKFSIAKDSIQSFATLRKYMKESHILHGVDISFELQKYFEFSITPEKVEYEY